MGHPKIHNETPFEFAPLFLADAQGHPLFVPLLKATFTIGADGRLGVAPKQVPVSIGGEFWGAPEDSSYRLAPEGVTCKPATDVVLIGHAYPAHPGDRETLVGLRVAALRKIVRVFGDRWWVNTAGRVLMSEPLPLERIPLRWERAFGGWDRGDPDPRRHACEARNPVGTGFRRRWNDAERSLALPNLEDPRHPIGSLTDRPPPAGFGFVAANWQPRAALAGTYDADWMQHRRPLLPTDFDPRFLNAAPPDQQVPGHLRGDEPIAVVNASPRGRLDFWLPGLGPPTFEVALRGGRTRTLVPVLDTLVIDADAAEVALSWRAQLPISEVPADLVAVRIRWTKTASPAGPSPWKEEFIRK